MTVVTVAAAQETIDIDNYQIFDGRDIGLPPAAEIDPKYLDDANFMYAYCLQRPKMAGQLDCGCWAMEYLAYLIDNPDSKKGMIMKEIGNKCYEPVKMEEHYTQQCLLSRPAKRKYGAQLSIFCDCVGGKVAPALLERIEAGQFGGLTMKSVQNKAQKDCGRELN
jgi:hypothetical protein